MASISELENQAESFSRNGDMRSAERVCRQILARDAQHLSSLRFLADLALAGGNFAAAETHLRALLRQAPENAQLQSRLGQALYRQGKLHEAARAYQDCWRANPRSKMVYLTLGCLHLELGNIDKAVQVFSLGEGVAPDLLSLWRNPQTNPAVAQMSKTAWQALCRHHTDLHVNTVAALESTAVTARIRDAVWPLADARPVEYEHPLQRAQVFYIRHDESPATSTSAPVSRTWRTLSPPMATDTSAFFTAKVPPKPQHSSACGSSTRSMPRTARSSRNGRSPTPSIRSEWQVGW